MKTNTLSWNSYRELYDTILTSATLEAPYDNPDYINYVTLNQSRQERWLKKAVLNQELVGLLKAIDTPQKWILITEPWCGDASHSSPIIALLAAVNPKIDFKVVLRDTPPFLIDNYLTNGGKSIPKLIVKDENNKDLFNWGPRPKALQEIYLDTLEKKIPYTESKITLQKWYNKDKAVSIQKEILALLKENLVEA